MDYKTVIERLKDNEDNIKIKAEIRNFKIVITDNKNNTGSITVWKLDNNKKDMMTFVETLKIEGISSFQVNIKKGNEILEHGLFLDKITQWIYNRINNENIKFIYQFFGGKYNGKTMTKKEVESLSSSTTKDLTQIRQLGGTCHRKGLDNKPLVKAYLSPMFSHIDYGLVYLRYETQEVYDMMSNK